MGTFIHVVLMLGNAALCVSNVISGDYTWAAGQSRTGWRSGLPTHLVTSKCWEAGNRLVALMIRKRRPRKDHLRDGR